MAGRSVRLRRNSPRTEEAYVLHAKRFYLSGAVRRYSSSSESFLRTCSRCLSGHWIGVGMEKDAQ